MSWSSPSEGAQPKKAARAMASKGLRIMSLGSRVGVVGFFAECLSERLNCSKQSLQESNPEIMLPSMISSSESCLFLNCLYEIVPLT